MLAESVDIQRYQFCWNWVSIVGFMLFIITICWYFLCLNVWIEETSKIVFYIYFVRRFCFWQKCWLRGCFFYFENIDFGFCFKLFFFTSHLFNNYFISQVIPILCTRPRYTLIFNKSWLYNYFDFRLLIIHITIIYKLGHIYKFCNIIL